MYKLTSQRMILIEPNNESLECTSPMTTYGIARPPSITRPKMTKFHRSVTYCAPSLWASLTNEVKLLNNTDRFDSAVRKIVWSKMATLSKI